VAVVRWILDKSAHSRLLGGSRLPPEISPDELAICPIGWLEWLYSARSASDYRSQSESLRASFHIVAPPPDIFDRVKQLQADLARHHGMWHRTPIPDLFIAETALGMGLGVLHSDGDYTRLAEVREGLRVMSLES
jgi:predicted nucleic acid-binding protein